MRLLDYLKQTMTPEEYSRAVYQLSGFIEEEIEELPLDAAKWLEREESNDTTLPA
jgi:hypothetical protein